MFGVLIYTLSNICVLLVCFLKPILYHYFIIGFYLLSTLFLTVNVGDRVAQLILERIYTPDVVEVSELDDTDRGAGGFGSTGVQQVASSASKVAKLV